MSTESPIITLLTDFGESDGYVGAMKGVMLNIAPLAQFVTISHQIAPQNIRQASRVLAEVYPYYPPHTVHLIVVDPGVGSERQPIAVQSRYGRFVAPDNGVLSPVLLADPDALVFKLENREFWRTESPSNTFHGRDIFSPVVAHLAMGVPAESVGSRLDQPLTLPPPHLKIIADAIKGEVIHVDRFGNVITSIAPLTWVDSNTLQLTHPEGPIVIDAASAHITCGWMNLTGIKQQYSKVGFHERLSLVGSHDELEIAVNQGNAAEVMSLKIGDVVSLHHGSR